MIFYRDRVRLLLKILQAQICEVLNYLFITLHCCSKIMRGVHSQDFPRLATLDSEQ